jgi:hypothetical protein
VRGHTPTFRVHGTEIKVSTVPQPEQTRKNQFQAYRFTQTSPCAKPPFGWMMRLTPFNRFFRANGKDEEPHA